MVREEFIGFIGRALRMTNMYYSLQRPYGLSRVETVYTVLARHLHVVLYIYSSISKQLESHYMRVLSHEYYSRDAFHGLYCSNPRDNMKVCTITFTFIYYRTILHNRFQNINKLEKKQYFKKKKLGIGMTGISQSQVPLT